MLLLFSVFFIPVLCVFVSLSCFAFIFLWLLGVLCFLLCYSVVIKFKGKENKKMNTVVSFDWGRNTITVAFTDDDTAHYFSMNNVSTVKSAKERMRRELRKEMGMELSYLKYWMTDGSVDYYRANRKR